MSDEPKNELQHDADGAVDVEELKAHNVHHSEVLVDKDLMLHAYEGENAEHEEGLWQAAKDHPMACLWAFLFCFTIVG
jgi:MFS transporter, SP family, general alpha glucoside:H+ symporter